MAESVFTDKNIDRIRNIEHDNFFDYLSSAYEVVRKIFSYLSLEDLEVVSEAVEKWRPIVDTTKNERTVIDSFVFSFNCDECKMWSEAKFGICFFLEEEQDLEKKLRKHLRENFEFLSVESRAGVIGTPNDLSQIIEQKMLKYCNPSGNSVLATYLRIPEFPDVGIKVFSWYKNLSFEDFKNNFSIPDGKLIKCLIILITFQDNNRSASKQKDDFVLFLQNKQSESFAVGGCLVDSFLDDPRAVTKYIVFYGDKVEAASLVLKQEIQTQEKINEKVEKLKSMCPKTKKGIMFVFRCCSRNKISRQPKVRRSLIMWESNAISKHFPSIPIIGCYGYGEFGRKFPKVESFKSLSKRPKQVDIWEYSLSTSLVYVGFNK